jgi:PII-like signaling protein
MAMKNITVVRIYLTEAENKLKPILRYLHDEAKVRGVTVFRGISGFGKSGHVYSSSLVDLSVDLPLVVEFFDVPERTTDIMVHLRSLLEADHMICWSATADLNS